MSGDLVLVSRIQLLSHQISSHSQFKVTGGTGHIGFRVLATALESGYTVRAAVRRAEQSEITR